MLNISKRIKIVLHLWKTDRDALANLIKNKIFSLLIKPPEKTPLGLVDKYIRHSCIFASNALSVYKNKKFDICIANDNLTLSAAYKVSKYTSAKFVYDAIECPSLKFRSGDAYNYYEQSFLEAIIAYEKFFIDQCDGLMAIGPSMLEWIQKHYETNKMAVIRNCRSYETMIENKNIKKDCNLSTKNRLALMINRVYPGQGEILIEALQGLSPNVHIATLGPITSKYKDALLFQAKELGVAERFHILPTKPWEEMLDYASGADMGIIPLQADRLNNRLSLPNRIFELVMARLPVATANIKDIKDIVESYEIGLSFDETKPESLVQCINSILSDDKFQTYNKNIDMVAQELCWEKEKQALLRFVKDVCPKKDSLSICLLTRKDIRKNNRIARISRALSEAGHKMYIGAPMQASKIQYDNLAEYTIVPFNKPISE